MYFFGIKITVTINDNIKFIITKWQHILSITCTKINTEREQGFSA